MVHPSPYDAIGGDARVRALADAFYDEMDRRPAAAAIRAMHPADLSGSRQKFYEFLSGWLGGPQLYVEKHGHPRLRRRHMPFAVDDDAAVQWMACMRAALESTVASAELRERLEQSFQRVAEHMRNR